MHSPRGMWVAWQGSANRYVTHVRDLSLGGVFIPTEEPPPVGTIVKLAFKLPSGEVKARGTVQQSQPGQGMGIEFKAMEQQDRARLYLLLKHLVH